jgi:hypothetical protein
LIPDHHGGEYHFFHHLPRALSFIGSSHLTNRCETHQKAANANDYRDSARAVGKLLGAISMSPNSLTQPNAKHFMSTFTIAFYPRDDGTRILWTTLSLVEA